MKDKGMTFGSMEEIRIWFYFKFLEVVSFSLKIVLNEGLFSRRMIQGGTFGGQVMGGKGVFWTVSWLCVVLVVREFTGFF